MQNTVTNDTQQVNLQTPREGGSSPILTFFNTSSEASEEPVVAQAVVAQAPLPQAPLPQAQLVTQSQAPVAQAQVVAQAPVAQVQAPVAQVQAPVVQGRTQQALPYLIADAEPVSPEIFTEEQARNTRLEARDSVSSRLDLDF